MKNYLKVTADLEDDSSVGLTGNVSSDGFSGLGEAWFNISEVNNFILNLEHFAKTTENPPKISGGHWDGEGNLILTLFSLQFYCYSTYRIGLQVHLASYPYTDCRIEEISKVVLELKPDNQEILNFCQKLNSLILGNAKEAYLVCN